MQPRLAKVLADESDMNPSAKSNQHLGRHMAS